ncbi:alpha/beta fold hydrolase [Streptomyces sp. SPB074]|uniref:alpha/beta fold hydrolase n=1 Tax=Streptomyces sp. (strain SPB074) TaxID=465543 RepID=UPI00017FE9DD|nr:alpha/beta hydrolase [Streptomyces sp. SPB074]EDY43624.1 alpha/beta superfamily hydrolase [Streptomyces sp. SPB074]
MEAREQERGGEAGDDGCPRSAALPVPGARIHYEVRNSGPLLVLLPGGGGDAGVFDGLAPLLADARTVVALDPRGYSHSVLDGPPATQTVERQADDVAALLAHLGGGPADVIGGSDGALVGLDLLARHPALVRRVLAHEPPPFGLLPGAEEHKAFIASVHETFVREGLGPAGARFAAWAGAGGDAWEPAPELAARLFANGPRFVEHELRSFTSWLPDVEALRGPAAEGRLVLAVGRETGGALCREPAVALASRLGLDPARLPGGHGGWLAAAPESAQLIRELMR